MKKYKICKILLVILAIFLCVFFYELLGICVAYKKQLEKGMMEYEKVSRQILEDGIYNDPYHVKPIELTKKRQRNIFLVQHLLGWARYHCFNGGRKTSFKYWL